MRSPDEIRVITDYVSSAQGKTIEINASHYPNPDLCLHGVSVVLVVALVLPKLCSKVVLCARERIQKNRQSHWSKSGIYVPYSSPTIF